MGGAAAAASYTFFKVGGVRDAEITDPWAGTDMEKNPNMGQEPTGTFLGEKRT
jgi:hypothetical protein